MTGNGSKKKKKKKKGLDDDGGFSPLLTLFFFFFSFCHPWFLTSIIRPDHRVGQIGSSRLLVVSIGFAPFGLEVSL